MKEINAKLLNPADLWEVHAGMIDDLEEAGRNRVLLVRKFGKKSAIGKAARDIESAIEALRAALLAKFAEYVESGATDAAIDAAEAAEESIKSGGAN